MWEGASLREYRVNQTDLIVEGILRVGADVMMAARADIQARAEDWVPPERPVSGRGKGRPKKVPGPGLWGSHDLRPRLGPGGDGSALGAAGSVGPMQLSRCSAPGRAGGRLSGGRAPERTVCRRHSWGAGGGRQEGLKCRPGSEGTSWGPGMTRPETRMGCGTAQPATGRGRPGVPWVPTVAPGTLPPWSPWSTLPPRPPWGPEGVSPTRDSMRTRRTRTGGPPGGRAGGA